MTVRYLGGALTAIMLTGGFLTAPVWAQSGVTTTASTAPAPATADVDTTTTADAAAATATTADTAPEAEWIRDASLLPPEESAVITIAGCLGGDGHDNFVLASPMLGPINSVPEARCNETVDSRTLELEHADNSGINSSLVGRWVEINGRLEKETSSNPDNLRELHVRSFRVLPVIPPRVAAAPESPLRFEHEPIAPAPAIVSEATPVGTSGVVQVLPKTASSLPAIGLLGMLSLVGGLAVHLIRSRAHA